MKYYKLNFTNDHFDNHDEVQGLVFNQETDFTDIYALGESMYDGSINKCFANSMQAKAEINRELTKMELFKKQASFQLEMLSWFITRKKVVLKKPIPFHLQAKETEIKSLKERSFFLNETAHAWHQTKLKLNKKTYANAVVATAAYYRHFQLEKNLQEALTLSSIYSYGESLANPLRQEITEKQAQNKNNYLACHKVLSKKR